MRMRLLVLLRGAAVAALMAVVAVLVAPTTAAADGYIIPEPPPDCRDCPAPPDLPYLAVRYHRVTVTIEDQVATTHIDQVFVNTSDFSLEGTYIFPLPEDAAISDFTMWVGGEPVQGELYTREEARRIYDDIVRRRQDPALLEYIGRDLFQASIFPIDPGDERRIEIEYSQVLTADGGLLRYVYPLSTERFSSEPIEDVSVSVTISSQDPIKAIYSPSHPVSVERDDDYHATAGWEASDVIPSTDFSLYYTVSQEALGVNLLSYKAGGEDGFFALLIAPNLTVEDEEVVAKDVVFVLDTSGSMEGEKIDQAKAALDYVLNHLNEGDRFNVVTFSTGVRAFANRPQPLSARQEALRFVQDTGAGGSTDINRALLDAMSGVDGERPTILVFLTDGLPTAGVTDTTAIIANVQQAAPKSVRLFCFGVGDDVDTTLLDTLSRDLRGTSAYVRPGERVDEQVSAFYAKVSTPVLADVSLSVDGVRIEDAYPYPLPDVFAGTQIVVVGRYRQGGNATIELAGQVNGEERTFTYDDVRFADDGGDDFIPRLWATRKVGYLLNEIRLHGENAEMIDEIVELSIRYGIITPYTSYLVEETDEALSEEGREAISKRALETASSAPAAPAYGSAAVGTAQEQAGLQDAEAAPASGAPSGENGGETVVTVGDKAFVLTGSVWTDTTFDPGTMEAIDMVIGSDDFYALLDEHPGAGRYFAIGDSVIVVLDGQPYRSVASLDSDLIADTVDTPDSGLRGWLQSLLDALAGLFGN
ncbi:MAG: VIT domain-containing protein [Anaerolineae bacterium]